jgi:transcriptional regulator with XRE-family HTH domain
MREVRAKEIGAQIRKYREAVGLTQADLADLIGKFNHQVSYYETGQVLPTIITLEKIAEALDISILQLLER